ncbi:MAG: leucyl aminopeptidase [bacterium]|nr:leucyl aminopeptidase [bacterium]
MKFTVTTKSLSQISTDLTLLPILEDKVTIQEKLLDKALFGMISKLRSSKDISSEKNKVRLIYSENGVGRIMTVGLGKTSTLTTETLREAISAAINQIKTLPVKNIVVFIPALPKLPIKDTVSAITESVILSSYKFPYYKKPENGGKIEEISLVVAMADKKKATDAVDAAQTIAQSVSFARDIVNHPSNIATPSHLAQHALELAKQFKSVKVKILHRGDIKKENMNALLAVAQGSDEEPKFIIIEYIGRKSAPSIALLGKGVTFDSGGISIKPADKMEEMKSDMAGAAAVMGTIRAAAQLKLPVHLVGLIPATENLPSGKAIKPGDIVRSRSGKTIEIINTDAEGRLVLADALDYVKKYKPELVIDYATLTGSITVALGDNLIGAFTNQKPALEPLMAAAESVGEKMWPMPLEKEYEQFIKSDFADLRNIGTIRYGDAINAALFLQHFVDYPWIHLDIASVAWTNREKPYTPKGATGVGVRSTIEFLKRYKK